jgi:Domain of unknown function (DUF4863)
VGTTGEASAMTRTEFTDLLAGVTARIAGRPLDAALEEELQRAFPADGPVFRSLLGACRTGIAEGWMCYQGEAGRKYGRVLQAGEATHRLSVDVVEIDDQAGPHHRHPNGEICLVMPVRGPATFDGHGAGWVVYGPGTAHRPTVKGGKALVLYMLPEGVIEFTKS